MSEPRPRFAQIDDLPQLKELDKWPQPEIWQQKINNNEVFVLEFENEIIGLLHYTVIWTTVPFINLIHIKSEYQKRGYSKVFLDFVKQELKKKGYVALLSSSQTNEPEPQAWHIHMGFKSNGIIENIDDEGIGEIVFRIML